MRIGLISDTHIPEVAQGLPEQIAQAFKGVDLILHAGDMYTLSVLDDLEHIAPVLAATGDDDASDTEKDTRVTRKHILKLAGYTLWLIHERPYSIMKLSHQEMNNCPDIVVFGHEHATMVHRYGSVLFVNPGSPTFLNYRCGLGTVAILDLESRQAETQIVQLS